MKKAIFILLCISFWNCNRRAEKSKPEDVDSLNSESTKKDSVKTEEFDYQNLESYLVPNELGTSKFQLVNVDCSVLIYPNEMQIDALKKGNEEDFSTIADDAMFYHYEASKYLDSAGIKTISASEKELIKFVGEKQTWTLNIRAANRPGWNIIFFKRNKSPKIFGSFALINEEIKTYFEK